MSSRLPIASMIAKSSTQSSSKMPPVPPVMHRVPTKPADSAGNSLLNRTRVPAVNPVTAGKKMPNSTANDGLSAAADRCGSLLVAGGALTARIARRYA